MAGGKGLLKVVGALMFFGGLLLIVASFYVFLLKGTYAFGTLIGLVIGLLTFIIGGFAAASSLGIFKVEQGAWRNSVIFTILTTLLLLLTSYVAFQIMGTKGDDIFVDIFAWACLIMSAPLAISALIVWRAREAFMPSEEEVKVALRRMGGVTVRTVSECPNCHEIVEKDWVQCPQCGTRLPQLCGNCGKVLPPRVENCPNCGAAVGQSEAAQRSIANLKELTEQQALPESRSVRYARLAEAYLKAGETDNALESLRKAIHYTEFDRKRSNFMVKMATILNSEGREPEALQILDAALALDPNDQTGALALKNAILVKPQAKAALEAYDKGDKTTALQLTEETLAVDGMNINGVGWIKSEQLVAKAEDMINAKAPSNETIAVLDVAAKLDPHGRTKAAQMREGMMPKQKAKRAKIPKMKSQFK
ncbi:MAG TPA: zinc ribbon domain-containing protein [Methanomassiliicoccales archaeon]|nr:zinc ribbon domain-containing protein [Methanomassiliicoccales archaeon]